MNKGTKFVWQDGKRITPFEQEWGMSVEQLATREQTTPEAIRMRLKRFGTPFQRRAKPSRCEIVHGKTVWQIANKMGVTHITVHKCIREGRDPYKPHGNRGRRFGGEVFAPVNASQDGWLMPEHPDYNTWREQYETK